MKKCLTLLLATLLSAGGLAAQQRAALSGVAGLEGELSTSASTRESFGLKADTNLFDLVATLSVNSDGRYGADIANFRDAKSLFDTYFLIEEGYTTIHLTPLDFQLGRAYQRELFQSPYSLFLSSRGPSANGMVLSYSDPYFQYESRWIELNHRSNFGSAAHTPGAWGDGEGVSNPGLQDTGFPERGANLKTIILKWNAMRFGIQDAAVYTGRSFDAEYFVNPIPEYFTQYFKTTEGRPWTAKGNENNLIGFFWDWKQPTFQLGAQVLIDDFSLHFLLPSLVPNNPWKAAWTMGGSFRTVLGLIGIHHAGALKYTFAPISTTSGQESVSAYGYTLYPSNEYWAGDSFRTLSIEDNALGYLHGENNLALMLTWANEFGRDWKAASSLEMVLAGTNSPTNPWHDDTHSNEVGTHWIDESVLARTFVWTAEASYKMGDWDLFGQSQLGVKGSVLALTDPKTSSGSALDRLEKIWRPSTGNEGVVALVLGARYHWDISKTLWK